MSSGCDRLGHDMIPYFEWRYKPPACFEEPFEIAIHGFRLRFDGGVAAATPLSPDQILDAGSRELLEGVTQGLPTPSGQPLSPRVD